MPPAPATNPTPRNICPSPLTFIGRRMQVYADGR